MKDDYKIIIVTPIGILLILLGFYFTIYVSIAGMTSVGLCFDLIPFLVGIVLFIIAGILFIAALNKKIARLMVVIFTVILVLSTSFLIYTLVQGSRRRDVGWPHVNFVLMSTDTVNHIATFQVNSGNKDIYWNDIEMFFEIENASDLKIEYTLLDNNEKVTLFDRFSVQAEAPGNYTLTVLYNPTNTLIWEYQIEL